MICALMCAIAVYLTKGASYDPHAATMCEMEIAHLKAVEKTLACDEEYIIVSNAEYGFLKPNYFEFKASVKRPHVECCTNATSRYELKTPDLADTLQTLQKDVKVIKSGINTIKSGVTYSVSMLATGEDRINPWEKFHQNKQKQITAVRDYLKAHPKRKLRDAIAATFTPRPNGYQKPRSLEQYCRRIKIEQYAI